MAAAIPVLPIYSAAALIYVKLCVGREMPNLFVFILQIAGREQLNIQEPTFSQTGLTMTSIGQEYAAALPAPVDWRPTSSPSGTATPASAFATTPMLHTAYREASELGPVYA